MKVSGNVRKMRTELIDGKAEYTLQLYDVLEPGDSVFMNDLIGKEIQIVFDGRINCVASGRLTKKTYGEGLSYTAFLKSPLASPSIIRPELSRIHEGVALRDKEWEEKHHNQPHITYLSMTSGIKVGVTRTTNIPHRWIDQGAVEAIVLAETPYRQLAGLIEVELKSHVADKTNWRSMLRNEYPEDVDLLQFKEILSEELPEELYEFVSEDDELTHIEYPVLQYPDKIKSLSLDKTPVFSKKLMGIKGQYLIFDDDTVFNMRKHTAYHMDLEF